MKKIIVGSMLLAFATFISACKTASDDPVPAQGKGSVHIEFDNQFEQDPLDPEQYMPLIFTTETYSNNAGEEYTITAFKYYISNIKLKKADGTVHVDSNSYYLIDASSSDAVITLSKVPVGNYTSMSYIIGIDSLQNETTGQTGALDRTNGMWDVTSESYLSLLLEGTSPQSTETGHAIKYHIGGYKNSNHTNTLRTVQHNFGEYVLQVREIGTPQVHLAVQAAKVAKNITFATTPIIDSPGTAAVNISASYANMIIFEHIHN
ncbi:MAG: hypothetical protein JWM14_1255 [Chitinophagaceae bacterium]|nr:hypothetical protein [Chitinophagaceae bacterium]